MTLTSLKEDYKWSSVIYNFLRMGKYLFSTFTSLVMVFPVANPSPYIHMGLVIDLRAEVTIVHRVPAVAKPTML